MNATDLFQSPSARYHHSESFWSSLFALQLIGVAKRNGNLVIPVCEYRESGGNWSFQDVDKIVITGALQTESVIVEGILCKDAPWLAKLDIPERFANLRPDIVLRVDDVYLVIETKTVGARISDNEARYPEFCEWFEPNGVKAEPYLLLSAGHQPDREIRRLLNTKWKLILWEKFFETVSQTSDALISRHFGPLEKYYSDPSLYRGKLP